MPIAYLVFQCPPPLSRIVEAGALLSVNTATSSQIYKEDSTRWVGARGVYVYVGV